MGKIKKTDHFYLIDGSGYIFRAYYALPPLTRKSDGLPTGAVSGFCSMLFKLLEDSKSNQNLQKPTHFAVIFDSARKTFRNEIYSDYKANRAEAPDDLAPQFDYIRKSVLAFNLPSVELTNYEADDLIATYTNMILKVGAKVTIVSSDKDLMQLYKKGVRIYDPMKNKFINDEDVHKKFGVTADKVIDVQALAGDSSDNVPGVPGIGVKTAAELIDTLSAPDFNKLLISTLSLIPPPTVRGIKQLSATLLTMLKRVFLPSFVAEISKKQISSAPRSLYNFACSTGSPASIRSTKFMPLTVRPS